MGELSARNFGLVIAYLIPGFIAVVAVAGVVPTIAAWLAAPPQGQPTIGGFLYATLASLAAGLVISSVRWGLIDTIHHRTGITPPKWDFSVLEPNLAAYSLLVEFHYRYYQFNANTFVAIAIAYAVRLAGGCRWCGGAGWADLGFVIVEAVLLAASRDALRKYYSRVSQVLGPDEIRRRGACHDERRWTRSRMGNSVGDKTQGNQGPRNGEESGEDGGGATGRSDGKEKG